MSETARPRVAVLADSAGAWDVLRHTGDTLAQFGVPFTAHTLESGEDVRPFVGGAESDGVRVWIVGNASAPPLSGRVASASGRPVLGVPIASEHLPALDALRATTASSEGSGPVASLAVGKAGAVNAALFAVAILANGDLELRAKLEAFRREQTEKVLADGLD